MLEFKVVCSPYIATTTGGAQRGVILVIRDRPQGWSMELKRFHGTDVVRYKFVSRGKRTSLVGAYLLPSTLEHLPDL